MKALAVILAGLALPGVAAAQNPAAQTPDAQAPVDLQMIPIERRWKVTWDVKAAPIIGADREVAPFPVGSEIIDDSEYSAGVTILRIFRNGAKLTLTPRASYNPNQFDAEEPASALSFGAAMKTPLTPGPDQLSWLASYRIRSDFDEAFEDYVRIDQTFGLGLSLSNILTCPKADTPCDPAWTYTIEPKLEWVESTEHDRERFAPSLTASTKWPLSQSTSVYLEGVIERRMFERVTAPNGDQLRDMRYSITAGVDVSRWVRRVVQPRIKLPERMYFKLGARWSAVSSNDPTRTSDRVYWVPEIGWSEPF